MGASANLASRGRPMIWYNCARLVAVRSCQPSAPCSRAILSDRRRIFPADVKPSAPLVFMTDIACALNISGAHQGDLRSIQRERATGPINSGRIVTAISERTGADIFATDADKRSRNAF